MTSNIRCRLAISGKPRAAFRIRFEPGQKALWYLTSSVRLARNIESQDLGQPDNYVLCGRSKHRQVKRATPEGLAGLVTPP